MRHDADFKLCEKIVEVESEPLFAANPQCWLQRRMIADRAWILGRLGGFIPHSRAE